jgi:hypothetical protein
MAHIPKNKNLGRKAKDKVTGFSGTITGYAQYLTGCDTYLLAPPCPDGVHKDGHWYDAARIEFMEQHIKPEDVTDDEAPGADICPPRNH